MTCAACVNRVERGLGKLEGVALASVNLATERARVVYDPEKTTPRPCWKRYGKRAIPRRWPRLNWALPA